MSRPFVIGLAVWLLGVVGVEALKVARVTVTTEPTLIYTSRRGGSTVLIRNAGTVALFPGPTGVTTTTGFEVLAGDAVTLNLEQSEDPVYGIVEAGTTVTHVLESGR